MNLRFAIRLARRESRSSWRRLGVYMGAITLGVAALVAINSYRSAVVGSVRSEARSLLGADLRLTASAPFPDSAEAMLDSLVAGGAPISRQVSTVSVALAPGGATRLVQLRAVDGDYPYYGAFETSPPGQWPAALRTGRQVLVEPAVMADLHIQQGDTLHIGNAAFRVAGTLDNLPAEVSFRNGLAPRVYLGRQNLDATGLVQYGSLVQYAAFVKLAEPGAAADWLEGHRPALRRSQVNATTAERQGDRMAFALDTLSRFLGLVGLTALLLGGVGVASAVHVFVKEKRNTIAVLRCLGATQWTAFLAYLLQAAALGTAGAAAGVLLGLAAQLALPSLMGGLLPVKVGFTLDWAAIAAGLLVGLWVSVLFALLPLLQVRNVPPLRALRQDVEVGPRREPLTWAAYAALAASILGLSIWQASRWQTGLAFAAGLAVTLGLLLACAWLLTRTLRRYFPRRAAFVVRQGLANLYRPHNQTAAVGVALGFGAFLVTTMGLVQANLLNRLRVDVNDAQPDLVAFDIQRDQRASVDSIFRATAGVTPDFTPIVTARIAAVNGRDVRDIMADSARPRRVEPWALRREYRNTYRDTLTSSEQLVAGSWWTQLRAPGSTELPRISMEQDVAESLGVGVGDRVTWDFQGIRIETRIASLRSVDWARFETNFFVVFEPGTIEDVPQSFVTLVRVPDAARRSELQTRLVRRHPNISLIDLEQVQETFTRIISRVMLAVRFMAFFSIVAGALVLLGAVAASRFQRLREGVLLRTLGASRRQVRRILLTEYLALGAMAGVTGTILGGLGSWALVHFLFDLPFSVPAGLAVVLPTAAALSAIIGLANSREALRLTPLAVLREAAE